MTKNTIWGNIKSYFQTNTNTNKFLYTCMFLNTHPKTLDSYLYQLQGAGYLCRQSNGHWNLIKDIPEGLSSSQVIKESCARRGVKKYSMQEKRFV